MYGWNRIVCTGPMPGLVELLLVELERRVCELVHAGIVRKLCVVLRSESRRAPMKAFSLALWVDVLYGSCSGLTTPALCSGAEVVAAPSPCSYMYGSVHDVLWFRDNIECHHGHDVLLILH